MKDRTAAVVVTYNRKELLQKNVEALLAQTLRNVLDILIIDNASTDGTREAIGDQIDKGEVCYYNTKANLGGAGGFSYGIKIATEKGYVETLFHRRRYISELASNNYMVRQFGARAAMNTPIQGTAADIMKIAMINVFNELEKNKIDAKIVLQVHDELIIESKIEEKERVKKILQSCMENVMKMKVPLKAELSEASNWYEAK